MYANTDFVQLNGLPKPVTEMKTEKPHEKTANPSNLPQANEVSKTASKIQRQASIKKMKTKKLEK